MATTTNTLPFGRTGAQAAGPSYTMEDLEGSMSMARMGLFLIVAISIGILVLAVMNVWMGPKKDSDSDTDKDTDDDDDTANDNDDEDKYKNRTSDMMLLAGSALLFLVSAATVFMSYPKRRQ